MPDVHAKLSASGAKKWLTCPGSTRLEEGLEDPPSVYAEEGTVAHSLSELKLQFQTGKLNKRTYTLRLNKLKKNEYYSKSMDDYTDEYVDYVMERFNSYESAFIDLEKRVDFSEWVPDGFGTSDVVIIANGVLEVIDLKYGQGVAVSAKENPQIMLYGLGAYNEYDFLYDFDIVRMTIMQPRKDGRSTYELPLKELIAWGDDFVRPRAELAISGEGECVPSEDACRFCKAKAVCRARAEANLEAARLEFEEPPEKLTPEEIAKILLQAPEIKKWIEHVETYALTQARDHGENFPGMKLVAGRSNRVISNKEEAAKLLQQEGFTDIFKPQELLNITKLEKAIGKDAFNNVLGDLIIKPSGKPTLVKETDKRPEINGFQNAVEEFKEEF